MYEKFESRQFDSIAELDEGDSSAGSDSSASEDNLTENDFQILYAPKIDISQKAENKYRIHGMNSTIYIYMYIYIYIIDIGVNIQGPTGNNPQGNISTSGGRRGIAKRQATAEYTLHGRRKITESQGSHRPFTREDTTAANQRNAQNMKNNPSLHGGVTVTKAFLVQAGDKMKLEYISFPANAPVLLASMNYIYIYIYIYSWWRGRSS